MDQHTGIRMCKYKEVRRDYGTIHYEQTQVEVPELKINYNELFEMKKLSGEDIPEFEQEGEIKKIEVKHKTKEEKIKQIAEETKEKTEKEINQELKLQEEQEEQEELRELEEEQKEEQNEEQGQEEQKEEQEEQEEEQEEQETSEQLEPEPEPEPSESSEQKGGGFLRKKIYVTNLSVEKDKEMFQM